MDIHLNSFPSHALSLLKERILPSYTAQQKIIILIASIGFGILAAWFVANRFCFAAKQLNPEEKTISPNEAVAERESNNHEQQEGKGLQLNGEYSLNQMAEPKDEAQQIKKNEDSQPLNDGLDDDDFLLSLWDLFAEADIPIVKPSTDSQIKQEDDALPEMLVKEVEKPFAIDKPLESMQNIPQPPSKDETFIEKPKLKAAPMDKVHQTQASTAPKALPPLTPTEEMIRTFENVWQHASPNEREWIKHLGRALIKKAEVLKWEKKGDYNEYSLEIKNELSGTHSNLPIGKLVMKQKMKIVFSEEKLLESAQHRKTIAFPDQGLCHRVGWGYLSKDTSLDRIIIEEHPEIVCTLEAFGNTVGEHPIFMLNFLNAVQWSS